MKFECNDLDRLLANDEWTDDAGRHLEQCASCRERLRSWTEISAAAPALREEWDSPLLWPRIEAELSAAQTPPASRLPWRWALAAAATILLAAGVYMQWPGRDTAVTEVQGDFLTADTLEDVREAEAAYRQSIERLSALAALTLDTSSTPLAEVYREKLILLDSAIAELKATAETNPYNAYLQTQLATLYQEKQKTLEDWVENAKSN